MLRQILLISSREIMLQTPNFSDPWIIFMVLLILLILTIIVIIILMYLLFADTDPINRKLIEKIDFPAGPHGTGGMAEVWKVDDPNDKTSPQKQLAVKFSKKNDGLSEYRFECEINNLRRLKHENCISYKEHGFVNYPDTNDKTRYLIMDFFDGRTINELLSMHSNKGFPHLAIIEIGRQIIDALEYCHKKEIVHRDLTLTNVLIDKNGQVCIIDFGNSTKVGSKDTEVYFKAKHGTLNFFPPEHLMDYASKKVDLYQLAVLMYAMYGGELFKRNIHQNVREKAHQDGREEAHQFIMSHIKNDHSITIPPKIREILLACLQAKYNDTYELRADLGLPLPNDLAQMVQNIANRSTSQHQNRRDKKTTYVVPDYVVPDYEQ